MLKKFHSSHHRALIFDCDGTIGDTMGLFFCVWTHALRELAVPVSVSWDEFRSTGGRCFRDTVKEYNERFATNIDVNSFVRRLDELYGRCIGKFRPIEPVVSFIADDARPMAVASSGKRANVEFIVSQLGLGEKFSAIVTQEDVTVGDVVRVKPAPDLFLLAAKKMGVPPGQCLTFGDSPLDEEAAKAAGMEFVKIPHEWWDMSLLNVDLLDDG
ncbi:MAG: HAD family phosphatase [Puniceicoccales bacterium]|jgi:beta-phosphoglucomutase-like phosphatase (HAD superfamily)|nr:HAD family phosphatase [Puniceicoccales bacterium]